MTRTNGPLRVGIGGPVGAGKTTPTAALCRALGKTHSIGVITNDIYTKEDAEALMRMQVLPEDRIIGVETASCPHTAIRDDASINLAAVAKMMTRHPDLEIGFIESGGDNLRATFSPELADVTLDVTDVAAGEEIPRKGGLAITRSDVLVINKTDLASHVGGVLGCDGPGQRADATGPAHRILRVASWPRSGRCRAAFGRHRRSRPPCRKRMSQGGALLRLSGPVDRSPGNTHLR